MTQKSIMNQKVFETFANQCDLHQLPLTHVIYLKELLLRNQISEEEDFSEKDMELVCEICASKRVSSASDKEMRELKKIIGACPPEKYISVTQIRHEVSPKFDIVEAVKSCSKKDDQRQVGLPCIIQIEELIIELRESYVKFMTNIKKSISSKKSLFQLIKAQQELKLREEQSKETFIKVREICKVFQKQLTYMKQLLEKRFYCELKTQEYLDKSTNELVGFDQYESEEPKEIIFDGQLNKDYLMGSFDDMSSNINVYGYSTDQETKRNEESSKRNINNGFQKLTENQNQKPKQRNKDALLKNIDPNAGPNFGYSDQQNKKKNQQNQFDIYEQLKESYPKNGNKLKDSEDEKDILSPDRDELTFKNLSLKNRNLNYYPLLDPPVVESIRQKSPIDKNYFYRENELENENEKEHFFDISNIPIRGSTTENSLMVKPSKVSIPDEEKQEADMFLERFESLREQQNKKLQRKLSYPKKDKSKNRAKLETKMISPKSENRSLNRPQNISKKRNIKSDIRDTEWVKKTKPKAIQNKKANQPLSKRKNTQTFKHHSSEKSLFSAKKIAKQKASFAELSDSKLKMKQTKKSSIIFSDRMRTIEIKDYICDNAMYISDKYKFMAIGGRMQRDLILFSCRDLKIKRLYTLKIFQSEPTDILFYGKLSIYNGEQRSGLLDYISIKQVP